MDKIKEVITVFNEACSASYEAGAIGGIGSAGTIRRAKEKQAAAMAEFEAKLRELLEREIRRGYAAGWDVCAEWAKRDDLKSDVGSTAYVEDRERRISNESKEM